MSGRLNRLVVSVLPNDRSNEEPLELKIKTSEAIEKFVRQYETYWRLLEELSFERKEGLLSKGISKVTSD